MIDLQSLERLPRAGRAAPIGEDSGAWELKSKATVERQIAEVLREKIIVGVIARGQKLKQAEIARLLGVSITPVREALRLLEAQGYVAVKAHRGAVVSPFVVEGAEELYELRQALESRLTREAARRMTSSRSERSEGAEPRLSDCGQNTHAPFLAGKEFSFSLQVL